MKNIAKPVVQLLAIALLLLISLQSQAQCPAGLGSVVNIASLPYYGTGFTTCGNGNRVGHLTATLCAEAYWNYGEDKTFIFTPTVTDTFAIVLKTDRTTADMTLYNGCPLNGGGGSCVVQVQNTSNPPFKAIVLQLTAGTTYYLVIDDSAASPGGQCIPSFDLSIINQPANDDCAGAINLSQGSQFVCNQLSGQTFGASRTFSAANVCGGSVDDDVWYKFVATSPYHTVTVAPLAPTLNVDMYVDVRAGSCDGANVACSWQGDGLGVTEVLAMDNLTVGTTYFIRVYTGNSQNAEFRGFFTICLTTPYPPNDECSGAIALTPALAPTTVTGTTVSASGSLAPITCNGNSTGAADDDVWYKFTAPGSQVSITASSTGLNLVLDIRSGGCNGSTIACANATATGGTETATATGLTTGTTYYARVYSFGLTNGAFTISATMPPPLPVELINFKAIADKDAIQLHWATASEHNNAGFQIERSENGRDFEKIAFIAGAGTSAEKHNYQLEDKNGTCLGKRTSIACSKWIMTELLNIPILFRPWFLAGN